MKKDWFVIAGIFIAATILGYLYLEFDESVVVLEDFNVTCNYTATEWCSDLNGSENECCVGSMQEALDKEWIVFGPDTCIDETGNNVSIKVVCPDGYGPVSATCNGSLVFCSPYEVYESYLNSSNLTNESS
jgi:hypothetical protein